jgi:hypothetical protein
MTEDRETLQKEAEAIKHRIESTRREAEQVAEHYNGQLKSLYEDLKVRDDALERLDGGQPTQAAWNMLPDRPLRIPIEWADVDHPPQTVSSGTTLETIHKILKQSKHHSETIVAPQVLKVPRLSQLDISCRCGGSASETFDPRDYEQTLCLICNQCGEVYAFRPRDLQW